jgi:UDP-N-acetylglucosamine 2-epimerase (non-hydrolysing)
MIKSKKIHIVIGTKAQLIKMAPIMMELEKKKIKYNFIFTGQHKETINEIRENFNIKSPDKILYTGKDITGIFQMLCWLTRICYKSVLKRKEIFGTTSQNDIVLVHGDTFSTVLGALMGKFGKIKIAHIESGLRSFNLFHPFPEEINRKITFLLSDYYFCPGQWAVNNLKKYKGVKINTKINTLFDTLQIAKNKKSNIKIPKEKYCICSVHRFENIFKKNILKDIIKSLKLISKNIKILFILHPPTKQQLEKTKLIKELENNKNIELRPRYNYTDFINLLNKAQFIITDGGSNQEESYYLGKPCLLMRKATEREEGLGKNVIISNYDDKKIKDFIKNYKKYNFPEIKQKESPSRIIVNYINKL